MGGRGGYKEERRIKNKERREREQWVKQIGTMGKMKLELTTTDRLKERETGPGRERERGTWGKQTQNKKSKGNFERVTE